MKLILAAGTQTRWNTETFKGVPPIKQLVEVDGDVLIERIQVQFPDSIVVTKTNDIKRHSLKWFEPEFNEVTLSTLFSTRNLWDNWNTILLGDVDYGEDTIKKIENQTEPIMFYGDKGEIYALKFDLRASWDIMQGISNILTSPWFKPKYGKLWNLYRILNKADFRTHIIKDYFTHVSDCKDFDNQKQYLKYAKSKRVRKENT